STAGADDAELQPVASGVVVNPGAMVVADHHLLVAQPPLLSGVASHMFSANLVHASVWTMTGFAYSMNGTLPSAVAGSRDGWQYESEDGEGVIERAPVAHPHAIGRRASVVTVHVSAQRGIAYVKISVDGRSFHTMSATR